MTSTQVLSHPAMLFLLSAVSTWLLTGVVLRVLHQNQILDLPTHRSSHTLPTPRGGGIAIIVLVAVMWLLLDQLKNTMVITAWLGLIAVATVSFLDDLNGVPRRWRFSVHLIAVILPLVAMPQEARIWPEIPMVLERTLIAIAWVWLTNLTNFMDGIDGLTTSQTIAVALGCALVTNEAFASTDVTKAVIVAGACVGFLRWNWMKAKVFLGDVGSIPLGYITGFLLLELALQGAWVAALILPSFFVYDATTTLIKRGIRGEDITAPHRQHLYQRAHRGGFSHGVVTVIYSATNLLLIAIAVWSLSEPQWAALAAGVVLAVSISVLEKRAEKAAP